jgi:hypothetical protein
MIPFILRDQFGVRMYEAPLADHGDLELRCPEARTPDLVRSVGIVHRKR